jgi:phosphate-selective porin OprO and OprP
MDRFPISSARLAARLALAALLATCASPAMAGGPPAWTTPAAMPTQPPAGGPEPPPGPSPTPVPGGDEEAGGDPGAQAKDAPGEAAAEDESTSEGGRETNPGAVAFTDYRPFDLESIQPQSFDSRWKGFVAGLRGLTRYSLFDEAVKFRLGGRFQLDTTAGDGNEAFQSFYGPIEADLGLRRGAIFAVGRVKEFNFEFAFDFGVDWGVDSAWIEGAEGGLEVWGRHLGKLRLGFMSEPFSLERQTSGYNTSFLERSLPVQTFSPGSNIGAMVHNVGERGRIAWAVGLFSVGKSNDQNASTSQGSVTARVSWLPVYRDGGRRLVHLGLAASSRSPTGGDLRYRSRPEARYVIYLANTGNFSTSRVRLMGAELATVNGPLWAAAEHIVSDVSADTLDNPVFRGSYIQVGWFITGETRPYRTNSGTFDRVRPLTRWAGGSPFRKLHSGAWEIVGRVSTVDLEDGLVEGGELLDFGAALNWYVNATTRIGLNYIRAEPKDRGSANIVVLRLQYNPW